MASLATNPPHFRAQRGSKDYELVEKLPEKLQCPICSDLLDNPHLMGCCGHHLCADCLTKIENAQIKNVRNCPLCQATEFKHLLDPGKQRDVNKLKVYCPNHENGCEWTGELCEVQRHLVADLDKGGCQFEEVDCQHSVCRRKVQRKFLRIHETEECPHRPFTCEHCGQYNSFYQDVVDKHYPVCDLLPVRCPNNCCAELIIQSKLSEHLENICELVVVPCDFHIVGCNVQRKRQEMRQHLGTCVNYHNRLLLNKMATIFGQVSSLEVKNAELHTLLQSLEVKHGKLQSQHTNLVNQHTMLEDQHTVLEERHTKLEDQHTKLKDQHVKLDERHTKLGDQHAKLDERHTKLGDQHAKLDERHTKLGDQHAKLEESHTNLSDENAKLRDQTANLEKCHTKLGDQCAELKDSYTKLQDCHIKLEEECTQLKVQNEDLLKRSENMSAQIPDMENRLQGLPDLKAKVDHFDEELKKAKDKFDREHKALADKLKEETTKLKGQNEDLLKKESEEMSAHFQDVEKQLQGLAVLVDHSDEELKNAKDKFDRERKELEDTLKATHDDLQARIAGIVRNVEYVEESFTPKPPFAFTVSRFVDRRSNKEAFVSPPFYSKLRGYKMCVRVDVCGMNEHVAVFCCIMRGEHDDNLRWPFRGEVVIRLQNHLKDDSHYEQRIRFDDSVSDSKAGRVKTGDKNYLHGLLQFISYKELNLNRRKNYQYLKGDALDFEVVEVVEEFPPAEGGQ